MNIAVIDYDNAYADETVAMWKASQEQALGFKHAPEQYLHFLRTGLAVTHRVFLAIDADSSKVVGMMATNEHELNQLYIHPDFQRMGVGSRLVELAKALSSGKLETRTFEINTAAHAFYDRHGFKTMGRSQVKYRGLDEIIYEWTSPRLACESPATSVSK